jgi:hypothetical protein
MSVIQFASVLTSFIITLKHYQLLIKLSEGLVGDDFNESTFGGLEFEFSTKILYYVVSHFICLSALLFLEVIFVAYLCSRKLEET